MVLEVKVRDIVDNSERVECFSQSPVRVGRNQLNDLRLDDPFVSEWHGIIRFDDTGVAYFDLGSTNGTTIAGKRLVKNAAVALNETSRLGLGRIALAVSQRRAAAGPGKTVAWGHGPVPAPTPLPSSPGQVATPLPSSPGQVATPLPSSPGQVATPLPSSPGQVATPLPSSPGQVATPLPSSPGPAALAKDSLAIAGRGRKPEAIAAAHPRDLIGGAQAGDSEQQVKIVRAFCEAFVGLKNGFEQFGLEVGVRTINGMTPLHKARTSQEVLEYLQRSDADVEAALRNLISIFADFGIHHIAMMEGVTEGVRAVLQSLDPRANGLDGGPGILSKSRYRELWKTYLERFDQTVSDDNELHAIIFGDDFARAYASVTIGDRAGGTGRKAR